MKFILVAALSLLGILLLFGCTVKGDHSAADTRDYLQYGKTCFAAYNSTDCTNNAEKAVMQACQAKVDGNIPVPFDSCAELWRRTIVDFNATGQYGGMCYVSIPDYKSVGISPVDWRCE